MRKHHHNVRGFITSCIVDEEATLSEDQ